MARDASAAQRAYEVIKQQIKSGELPVRSRIDVEALSRLLGLSSMPVRQALNVLTWERLVRPGKHAAYEVALWSALELQQLYEWRGALLLMALPSFTPGAEVQPVVQSLPYHEAVEALFRRVDANANPELKRAALSADERLSAARRVESEILSDVAHELQTLAAALDQGAVRTKSLFKAYTRRRIAAAGHVRGRVVLKALASNGPAG
jgi:hypothetical protein